MLVFIARRLVVSLFVLFAASFVMFVLAANVGDPLADLRELPEAAQESAMAERIERGIKKVRSKTETKKLA